MACVKRTFKEAGGAVSVFLFGIFLAVPGSISSLSHQTRTERRGSEGLSEFRSRSELPGG